MFAQCLDRKEQSAGDVALGVFLLGTDIDDGQLVAKRVHQLQGFSRGERAGLREFGGGGVAVCREHENASQEYGKPFGTKRMHSDLQGYAAVGKMPLLLFYLMLIKILG